MTVGSIQGQAGHFFTTALGGCLRIPALLVTANAVAMTGELALRGLQTSLEFVGLKLENKNNFVNKAVAYLPADVNFRPYRHMETKKLAMSAVGCAIVGIAATEFANFCFGPAPAVYNRVLTYLGPIRLHTGAFGEYFRTVGLMK